MLLSPKGAHANQHARTKASTLSLPCVSGSNTSFELVHVHTEKKRGNCRVGCTVSAAALSVEQRSGNINAKRPCSMIDSLG